MHRSRRDPVRLRAAAVPRPDIRAAGRTAVYEAGRGRPWTAGAPSGVGRPGGGAWMAEHRVPRLEVRDLFEAVEAAAPGGAVEQVAGQLADLFGADAVTFLVADICPRPAASARTC